VIDPYNSSIIAFFGGYSRFLWCFTIIANKTTETIVNVSRKVDIENSEIGSPAIVKVASIPEWNLQ